jgi:hypothetical protein
MRMLPWIAIGGLLAGRGADPGTQEPDPCQYFYEALEVVPHDILVASSGDLLWMWHEQPYTGCQVRFVTNDSIRAGYEVPEFDALEGSEMYRLGWRFMDSVGADGPGSGIFGIERDSVQCLVRWEQSAWIDDEGEFQQSDVLEMTIQCRQRPGNPVLPWGRNLHPRPTRLPFP